MIFKRFLEASLTIELQDSVYHDCLDWTLCLSLLNMKPISCQMFYIESPYMVTSTVTFEQETVEDRLPFSKYLEPTDASVYIFYCHFLLSNSCSFHVVCLFWMAYTNLLTYIDPFWTIHREASHTLWLMPPVVTMSVNLLLQEFILVYFSLTLIFRGSIITWKR